MIRTLFLAIVIIGMASVASSQSYVNGQPPTPNMDYLVTAGAKMSPQIPFYRIGEPVVIPFTPTSGSNEFPVTVPSGATSFQYTLNAPCAVRLKGRLNGGSFVPVTATTGWLWLPGSSPVYTSLIPVSVSVMSVDGPNASVQAAQKACSGNVELQYGTGQ